MKKLNFFLGAVLSVLFSSLSFSATYYVDNNGSDKNNGISATTPWKTITKVNSHTFSEGDIILFKRGSTWKETLIIKHDGTPNNSITYASYGNGNLPLIDGNSSIASGIYMDGRNYITIEEINIRNTTHSAIRIKRSEHIIIKNNEMYVTGSAGVFIEESVNCLIAGNIITTPSNQYNVQTDGIYAQKNSDNVYDGNHITISNQHKNQHCDGIQFYLETSAIIKNNYIEQDNNKSGNAQGIYCSENYGTFQIYNNVCYGMFTASGLIKFSNASNTSGKAEIIGNTLYGGKGGLVQINAPDIIFKNNIVVSAGVNPVVFFHKKISTSNINYNLLKNHKAGSKLILSNGTVYSLSNWRSLGYDKNTIEKDPGFNSIASRNFTLIAGSPAIDRGVNLDFPFNVDKLGITRPSGISSDIGAFEMEVLPKVETKNHNKVFSEETTPVMFELEQNYPNPFNPSTIIKYSLPENSLVTLKIYDITGSEIAELINGMQNAGFHEIIFNASDLASGTYIYRITAKDFIQTRKMILLK